MARLRQGINTLNIKLGKINAITRTEVFRALLRGGLVIEGRAVEGIIDPPKTGRKYRSRGSKAHMHQASAPGQFPAADTGELHTSITTLPIEPAMRVEVGANTPYAGYLEFGTTRMEPRPFMKPSYDEKAPAIVADVRAAVARAAKAGSR